MLMLSACDRLSSSDHDISGSDSQSIISEPVSEYSDLVTIPNEQDNMNQAVKAAREEYNITLPIVVANETLALKKIDLPEQMNGHSYGLNHLIDDETVLVHLFDIEGSDGIYVEMGFYNINTDSYYSLNGLPSSEICASNRDYIVYKVYNSDFTKIADDESVNLFLYDVTAQKSKKIYTYSFTRDIEFYGGHWKNNIVMKDNKVYFDDIIDEDGDLRVFLFSYDISSEDIVKLKDDAQHPIAYKDTILYVKTKDDNFRLESLNGEYSFEMNGHIQSILPMGDDIFSLDAISSDDEKRETKWGVKNMLTGEYILKTTRTISDLKGNDTLISFRDWGLNCPPVFYNVKDNIFMVFDDLPQSEKVWYFSDNAGIIFTAGIKPSVYMFNTDSET